MAIVTRGTGDALFVTNSDDPYNINSTALMDEVDSIIAVKAADKKDPVFVQAVAYPSANNGGICGVFLVFR